MHFGVFVIGRGSPFANATGIVSTRERASCAHGWQHIFYSTQSNITKQN